MYIHCGMVTLSAVYGALWRRKYFTVAVALGVAAAAWALSQSQQKLYTASSLIRVEQKVTGAGDLFGALQTGERLARTYVQIAETRGVERRVRELLGPSVPRSSINIDASQVANLELVNLSNTADDPVVAAKVANAIPAALEDFIKEAGTRRDTITTIETASVPIGPSSPNTTLNVALGLIVGLILAAGLALLFEALSDRLPAQEELEKLTGHAVIASIPKLELKTVRAAPTENIAVLPEPVALGRDKRDAATKQAARTGQRAPWRSDA